eukprot:m.356128 g.356128  ORF g.356128 m.356128 type:complete len:112 (-) comp17447_c0_seq1:165-500(-)
MMESAEEQVHQTFVWYRDEWNDAARDTFLAGLIDRTQSGPDADVDGLLDMMVKCCGPQALPGVMGDQMHAAYQWFRLWDDAARNHLMNLIEDIDMSRCYKWYDEFAAVRWT